MGAPDGSVTLDVEGGGSPPALCCRGVEEPAEGLGSIAY